MPIHPGMVVWPGDGAPRIERVLKLEDGDPYNLTSLHMSAHTGTHVDAPLHFLRGAADIGSLPLDALLGRARVIDVVDPVAVQRGDLPPDLKRGDRVLFRTLNSVRHIHEARFVEEFVYVSKEAALDLVELGVAAVGIDYLSIGGFRNDLVETHEILLGAGVWVIECLDLSGIEPGEYELACMPLKIPGADGAPARAALRRL